MLKWAVNEIICKGDNLQIFQNFSENWRVSSGQSLTVGLTGQNCTSVVNTKQKY